MAVVEQQAQGGLSPQRAITQRMNALKLLNGKGSQMPLQGRRSFAWSMQDLI